MQMYRLKPEDFCSSPCTECLNFFPELDLYISPISLSTQSGLYFCITAETLSDQTHTSLPYTISPLMEAGYETFYSRRSDILYAAASGRKWIVFTEIRFILIKNSSQAVVVSLFIYFF